MSSYFSMPSFARAKKNKEDLEKTNPQKPVLDDGDEEFLNKQIETKEPRPEAQDAPATKITEDGEEKEAPKKDQEEGNNTLDQVVVPEEKPATEDGVAQEQKQDASSEQKPEEAESEEQSKDPSTKQDVSDESKEAAPEQDVEDPPEQAPEDSTEKVEATAAKAKKSKKNTSFDLPSQEEAEAATRGFNAQGPPSTDKSDKSQGEKKTWTSYLPSIGTGAKKDQKGNDKSAENMKDETKPESTDAPKEEPSAESKGETQAESKEGESQESAEKRTWAQYASSAYAALPSIPSLPAGKKKSKDKDSNAEPVYNEDGTINEEETKKKQEQEVSVLLDNLNMSSINNRVFAFSGETQKIYERFALVLKDTMEGGPTAYEDMDKLMKDAGPQLEKQFQSMPPFVQTLVKSLPSKLGTSLGPELLAAASAKPGDDMKTRMATASKQSGSASASTSGGTSSGNVKAAETNNEEGQKKKRKIPGLKGLVSQQGTVASILRNVVGFLQVRFPFLASMTNVVMSLAVFILMFVFWYCHKRGKEARLAREAAATGKDGEAVAEVEDDDIEVEVTDEEGEEEDEEDEKAAMGGKEPESIAEQEDSAEAVTEKVGRAAPTDNLHPESIAKQEDSAEAVGMKTEEPKATGEAEPESIAKQEDSAEAVSEAVDHATTAESETKPIAQQEDSAEAMSEANKGHAATAKGETKPIAEQEDSAEAVAAESEKKE